MSGLLLSGCCGCAGKQCTRRYEFDAYPYLQWDLVDDPAGSTPVAITWDDANGRLDIEGEGSATVQVTGNPKTISVAAEIQSLTSGSAGVTVRRVDSSESISLWWMGGTSYELRHGTTVLESIVGSGSGEVKVELATPREATTDVLVYIGGTLAHTETAVAFVMPDVLHLGMIVDGEATFEWAEISPCPIYDCRLPAFECLSAMGSSVTPPVLPAVWTMSVPAIANLSGDIDCDLWGDADFVLLERWGTVGYDNVDGTWETPISVVSDMAPLPGDAEVYLFACSWIAVIPTFDTKLTECAGVANPPPIPSNRVPVQWVNCPFGTATGNHPSSVGLDGPTWMVVVQYRNVGTEISPDLEFRVRLSKHESIGSTADYVGSWEKYNSTAIVSGSRVLSLVQNSGCDDLPATITVTAGGELELARRILECDETCEPPVTPVPGCMQVTLVDEADTPISYSVPMVVAYNEATGSWEWTGSIGSWEHPTCGTIPLSSYKIHCVEPQEGAAKQWVLDITTTNGTSRISLSDDPTFGPVFDGTANVFCPAETWDVFAIFPVSQEPETDIFGCEDTTCQLEGYCISGAASCDTGTCAQNSFGNFLGATSGNPPGVSSKIGDAFTGPYPVAFPSGYNVWLWKDGGGIHLAVYNGTTLIEEATPLDIDCDQGDKTFDLSDPAFACCSGFGGVTLTLIPCGGPIVHV